MRTPTIKLDISSIVSDAKDETYDIPQPLKKVEPFKPTLRKVQETQVTKDYNKENDDDWDNIEDNKEKIEYRKHLTKEEKEANIIEWTTFFRRNPEYFNKEILGLKLKEFQNDMIQNVFDGEVNYLIASRGLSKKYGERFTF